MSRLLPWQNLPTLSESEVDSLCEKHISHSSRANLNEFLVKFKKQVGIFKGIVRT